LASALETSKYIILLAGNDPQGEDMTPLRLQKLLYYAQGWSLALRDCALFDEQIQAWPWGPVVPEVYQAYKHLGRHGIPADNIGDIQITDDERDLLDAVWGAYKGFSAIRLSEMTHDEPPWKDARGSLRPESPSSREIRKDDLKRYFKTLAKA